MSKFYAGIGSRQTPEPVLAFMRDSARALALRGWTLRSGGAPGADSAFQAGAEAAVAQAPQVVPDPHIYLPWPGFEGVVTAPSREEPAAWTFDVAMQHHPAWGRLKQGAQKLHSRNVHQVLGDSMSSKPSSFVLCWTPSGAGGGGTGQALRIARAHSVPVFDLGLPGVMERVAVLFGEPVQVEAAPF